MKGGVATWVGGGMALALATFACRQIVGIQDDPPEAPTSGVCGLPYSGQCATCVSTHCCDQASACAADPSCAPYASCLAACGGDPRCRAKCTGENEPPGTPATGPPLSTCVASRCPTECGLECGGLAGFYSGPDAAVACDECLAMSACKTEQACATSETCAAYGLCDITCQSRFDCLTSCSASNEAGVTLFTALAQTYEGECAPACASGNNWACLGHVSWPAPKVASTAMTLNLLDATSTLPVPGVTATLCASNTGACNTSGRVSDAMGLVSVTVPLPPIAQASLGPTGFIRLTDPGDGGAASLVPELVYWVAPLSEANDLINVPAVTVSELGSLLGLVKVDQAATRGFLVAAVYDCLGPLAPGVHVQISPSDSSQEFYYANRIPSRTASETDRSGAAVFTNVASGPVEVTATFGTPARTVSHAGVLVQPGTITFAYMVPTP